MENAAAQVYRAIGRPGSDFGSMDLPRFGGTLEGAVSQLANNINHTDVSTDGLYIEQSFSTPSIGYDHFAEMCDGMLAFSIRVSTGDEGSTFIVALHQLNGLMREQWDDFVISTTPGTNPRLDGEAQKFLAYLQQFGEHGLGVYNYYFCEGNMTKLQSMPSGLNEFWKLAKSDRYCYLTLFGIRERVSYLGPIVNSTTSRTLEPVDNRGRGQGAVVVGMGGRVPCTQIFGRRDEITDQVKLHVIVTRIVCPGGGYGSFCIMPGFGDQSNITFRDESGLICQAQKWHVGRVHTVADKESGSYAVQMATNLAPAISNDTAWKQHSALPMFFVNAGL